MMYVTYEKNGRRIEAQIWIGNPIPEEILQSNIVEVQADCDELERIINTCDFIEPNGERVRKWKNPKLNRAILLGW